MGRNDGQLTLGQYMRYLRLQQGWSQRELARRGLSSKSHISDFEIDKVIPRREKLATIDEALGANGDLLAMLTGDTSGHRPDNLSGTANRQPIDLDAPTSWVASEAIEYASRLTREDLSLDRRAATRALAGAVISSALLDRLERWISPPEQATSQHRRPGVGYEEVQQIEQAAHLFRQWDDQFGGGLRRKAVVGQLSEVVEELRDFSHPPKLTRRLFDVMAYLAETAATMCWDSGQGALAQRYYVMALRATKESGNRAFGANVLAGMARQQYYLEHVGEGLELVRLAQDGVDGHATPTIRAMLYTREAWAYAKQGRMAAFGRATGRAEDCLRDAKPADDPDWISYFDESELAGVTGGRLLEAAHRQKDLAGDAATRIQQAVELRRPRRLRSAALDQLGLAEARLLGGDVDEAARLGLEAADTIERTHSDRVRVKMIELFGFTDPYASVAPVADLRARFTNILNRPPALGA